MNTFRECGECTACCSWLSGDAYGHSFGNGISCKFLCSTGCSIHKIRPETCKNYQCAWSQGLFESDWRPDKINVLISVEVINSEQCLKVIPINNQKINSDIRLKLDEWAMLNNTHIVYLKETNIDQI